MFWTRNTYFATFFFYIHIFLNHRDLFLPFTMWCGQYRNEENNLKLFNASQTFSREFNLRNIKEIMDNFSVLQKKILFLKNTYHQIWYKNSINFFCCFLLIQNLTEKLINISFYVLNGKNLWRGGGYVNIWL